MITPATGSVGSFVSLSSAHGAIFDTQKGNTHVGGLHRRRLEKGIAAVRERQRTQRAFGTAFSLGVKAISTKQRACGVVLFLPVTL